jgi:hypothetical protein
MRKIVRIAKMLRREISRLAETARVAKLRRQRAGEEMVKGTLLAVVAMLSLAISAAQARPRDDVMSGAFRCASIADARTWLDCYYGAAQPLRAALSMPPVPSAQARLATQPPAGPVAPSDTALRDQIMSEAFRCNRLSAERQWLECYYAAANSARTRLGLSVSAGAAVKPGAPLPQPSASGLKAPAPGNASRMRSYSFDRYGIFTVTLENGEVWRQISGDSSFARWKEPAQRYAVRITRGVLGSYNLQVRNSPGLFKVRPVR